MLSADSIGQVLQATISSILEICLAFNETCSCMLSFWDFFMKLREPVFFWSVSRTRSLTCIAFFALESAGLLLGHLLSESFVHHFTSLRCCFPWPWTVQNGSGRFKATCVLFQEGPNAYAVRFFAVARVCLLQTILVTGKQLGKGDAMSWAMQNKRKFASSHPYNVIFQMWLTKMS